MMSKQEKDEQWAFYTKKWDEFIKGFLASHPKEVEELAKLE